MKYVSIDAETTGLDPDQDQPLEFAFVFEDTNMPIPVEDLPFLRVLVRHDKFHGDAIALAMNASLLREIHASAKWPTLETPCYSGTRPVLYDAKTYKPARITVSVHINDLADFLSGMLSGLEGFPLPLTAAGKNAAGFDLRFIPRDARRLFRHRVLDPGSVFVRWTDAVLPDLATLKKRLDLPGAVAHTALEDARDVIRVLRCAPGYSTLAPEVPR